MVLFFRRKLPESPRWLISQGRVDEARAIITRLEEAAGVDPSAPRSSAEVPQHSLTLRQARGELFRRYPGRLAFGCVLDLSEAFGYYGIFAVLAIVVLKKVHYTDAEIPFFFILGNVGSLVGGAIMTAGFDRMGRRITTGMYYTLAAVGVGLLAIATDSGSKVWVLLAYMVSNAFANGAWTSAYPTFTELFPTHLRAVGVGVSVGVGRIGAAYGTLYLPSLAASLGATPSYLLIVGFWLLGVVAIIVYSARRGTEAAGQPLDAVSALPGEGQPAPTAVIR